MLKFITSSLLIGISFLGFSQVSTHHEIGVEVQAASISTRGGTIGGALKFAIVQEKELAFGPSLRFQYIWSHDLYYGTENKSFTYGGGAFLHYRFLEWFFVGTEIEILKNPFTYHFPDKQWALTAFLGGGISKDFGKVRLNVGLLYDIADGLRSTYNSNPSPLNREYFLRINDSQNPNMGRYIPLIYRFALFIPIN